MGLFHYKPHSHTNLKTTISTPIFAMSTPIFLFFIFFYFSGGVHCWHHLPRQHLLTWHCHISCHVSTGSAHCWRGRWRGSATSAGADVADDVALPRQQWVWPSADVAVPRQQWGTPCADVAWWRGGVESVSLGKLMAKLGGVILLVFKSLGGYLFSFEIGF